MAKSTLVDTGERMIPEYHTGGLIYAEHTTRYIAAKTFVSDRVVLDIACGSGYGTQELAKHAKKVIGVDVSEEAVAYAKEHFAAKNIDYLVGSATEIPCENNSIDTLVTFETIEHISEYEKFLQEMKRVLKKGGQAIVSTPNDLEFAEGNHFHLHEFQYAELMKLLKKYFKYTKPYFQATWKAAVIGTKEQISGTNIVMPVDLHNFAPLPDDKILYFYVICSDEPITEAVEAVAGLGEHYSERRVLGEQEDARNVKAELKRREKEFAALEKHAQAMTKELEKLRQNVILHKEALENIQNSKTYKITQKIARAKRKISKN